MKSKLISVWEGKGKYIWRVQTRQAGDRIVDILSTGLAPIMQEVLYVNTSFDKECELLPEVAKQLLDIVVTTKQLNLLQKQYSGDALIAEVRKLAYLSSVNPYFTAGQIAAQNKAFADACKRK